MCFFKKILLRQTQHESQLVPTIFNSGRVSGRLFLIKKKTDAAAGGLIGARIYVVARVVVGSSITISVVFELNPVGPISGPFLFLLYGLSSYTVFFCMRITGRDIRKNYTVKS